MEFLILIPISFYVLFVCMAASKDRDNFVSILGGIARIFRPIILLVLVPAAIIVRFFQRKNII